MDGSRSDAFIQALEKFLAALHLADERGLDACDDVDRLAEELVAASIAVGLGDEYLSEALEERRRRRRATAS